MPDELSDLDQIADAFAVEIPPPGSSWEARGAFLKGWLDDAATVAQSVADVTGIGAEPRAVDLTVDALSASSAAILAALRGGAAELGADAGVRLARATVAGTLLAGYAAAAGGAALYTYPAGRAESFRVRARISPDELAADYERRLGVAQAIVFLASSGALDLILTSGRRRMGAGPWLIVVVILALVALDYIGLRFFELDDSNKRWRLTCLDENGKLIAEFRDLCVELGTQPAGWTDKLLGAVPWVAGGVLLAMFALRR